MKISVIIPLYNAEKYLDACLESLLIQTFEDFEVIVVDDCSTDASATIAENYLERFDGRLKLVTLEQNTGSGAIPRNEGLKFSRGEYVFFMDDDDFLVDTALETLYNCAANFNADVVCMSRGFTCDANGKNFLPADWDKTPSQDAPIFETENFAERVENFMRTQYGWAPWTKFLRRDFLIANRINFPPVKISEDVLWTFKVICAAESFLRVPNRFYVHRVLKNSWSHIKRNPVDKIKFWLDPLVKGLNFLEDFLNESKFFAKNPRKHFEVTNFFVKMQLAAMLEALDETTPELLYETIRAEFADDKHAALIANLFVFMNYYRGKNRR